MSERDVTYNTGMGKLPPQAIDIEEAVIGICLNDTNALLDAMDIIKSPSVFYKDHHQKIFTAIMSLYARGGAVDILSVTEELKKLGNLEEVGGPLFITQLSGKAAGGFQTAFHSKIIIQKWIAREVIRITTDTQRKAFDETEDIQDTIGDMVSGITDAINGISAASTQHISGVTNENLTMIEEIMQGTRTLQGISTKIIELDDFCNGLQNSDLIILAARTSMGKTSLAATIAYNVAVVQKIPTIFFSLEMTNRQLDLRLKILSSEIESDRVYKGKLNGIEYQRITEETKKIADSKLFVDDTPGITLMDMRTKLKRISMKENIGLVLVDYLQLMRTNDRKGKNREQEVSEISQGLKNIAKEFNVPVIALSQLSRATEMSSDQRPKLSHLRESGSQEQDADQVWFIYRAFKVGIKQDDHGNSTYDKAEIIIAKHRNGPTGSAHIGFHEKIMKFMSKDKLGDTQLQISEDDLYGGQPPEENPF